jgi:hypothetical protein
MIYNDTNNDTYNYIYIYIYDICIYMIYICSYQCDMYHDDVGISSRIPHHPPAGRCSGAAAAAQAPGWAPAAHRTPGMLMPGLCGAMEKLGKTWDETERLWKVTMVNGSL